jgi:hypothetical protein
MTAVNAIKIGKKFIGEVLNVENGDKKGIIAHHHLRIRIAVNILHPLHPGFFLPRQGLSSIWIKFLYERLADYCIFCGLIGHRKNFCPGPLHPNQQELFIHSLCGYVYPGTRLPPTRPAHVPSAGSSTSLRCSEDFGSGLHSPMEVSHSSRRPRSFFSDSPPVKHGRDIFGLPGHPFTTSPHSAGDKCSKGKENFVYPQDPVISPQSVYQDARYLPSAFPEYPPGFRPFKEPSLHTGPSITGPIIQGPTDQHSSSGHLQLAQQLTGVMGHSSSGLTLFGPSALHFYHGPSSVFSDVSTRDPDTLLPSPSSMPRDLHVSQPLSSHFFTDTLGSLGISQHAYQPDFQHFPMSSQPQVYTNPIISIPPSTVQASPHPTPNPSAYTVPNILKSSHSRPSRSSPRLHPYKRNNSVSVDHGKQLSRLLRIRMLLLCSPLRFPS